MVSSIPSRSALSRDVSGSSSSRNSGAESSARPMAMRRASPPEKRVGIALEQVFDVQQGEDVLEAHPPGAVAAEAMSVKKIAPDREMRKQPAVLEDISAMPPLRRFVQAQGVVEQHAAGDRDAAGIGLHDPRDHVEDRRLAGPGGTDERRHRAFRRECRGNPPLAQAAGDVDLKEQGDASPAGGGPGFRTRAARRRRAARKARRAARPAPPIPAPAARNRWRAAASASDRGCWTRK